MNRAVFCVVAMSFALVLLSGCAAHSASVSGRVGTAAYDSDYMLAVEHKAAQRGVKVRWIAPPMKPLASAGSEDGDRQ